MARAFLSSLLLWWSMSSISRSFCKGQQGELRIRAGTPGANKVRPELGSARLSHSWPFISAQISSSSWWPRPRPGRCCTYLGDLREDDPSVLPGPSQGLHLSQEFFPLLDFSDHWTERRSSSHRAIGPSGAWWGGGAGRDCLGEGSHPQGSTIPDSGPLLPLPSANWPILGLRSSNRSGAGAGAGSFRCTARGCFFRSSLSLPEAKMLWSLRFSFSRSPVRPRKGPVRHEGPPVPCSEAPG